MRAGAFTEVVEIYQPTPATDDYGVAESGWTLIATMSAAIRYLRGGESVQTARLAGRQPVVFILPDSGDAARVTTDWRIRNLRDRVDYNVRSVMPTDERDGFEITAESGVAI